VYIQTNGPKKTGIKTALTGGFLLQSKSRHIVMLALGKVGSDVN
jgi:hypothetical protein